MLGLRLLGPIAAPECPQVAQATLGGLESATAHAVSSVNERQRLTQINGLPAPAQGTALRAFAYPTIPSPQLAHRHAAEHLGDAGAGGAAGALGQRAGRKEAVRDDFMSCAPAGRPGGSHA